jgi:hypothetical protein
MRISRFAHGVVLLLVALGGAGCQAPSGDASPAPTASAGASAAAAADCPDIDLSTPLGNRIDLNGTWTSGTSEAANLIVYEIHQSGECLWGRAYSAYVDQDPGESFDMILVGTIRPDFTAEVDLLELDVNTIFFPHFGRASATWAMGFEGTGEDEAVNLEITAIQARAIGPSAPGGRLFPTGGPIVGAILTRSP